MYIVHTWDSEGNTPLFVLYVNSAQWIFRISELVLIVKHRVFGVIHQNIHKDLEQIKCQGNLKLIPIDSKSS